MDNIHKITKIIVIGSGIAGLTAAEELRKNSETAEITVVSNEKQLPYYRLSLIRFLAGEKKKESMTIHSDAWYEEKRITIKKNVSVSEIVCSEDIIVLDSGERLNYDKLIIASGSNPFLPPIPGCKLKNVLTIRKIEDIEYLMGELPNAKNCVCVGGGIIGIEVAGAMAKNNVNVTLVQNTDRLMPTQLNDKASKRLEMFLNEIGIVVKENATIKEISGTGHCERIILTTEEVIEADIVTISAGVIPETELAKKAGLKVERGLVVNNTMQTSIENIYGAGDATQYQGKVYGLWNVAQIQGKIAALSALGIEAEFEDILNSNTVKVLGIDIFSIGEFIPKDEASYEFEQETSDSYMNLIVRENKIIGGILLSKTGNKSLPMKIKQAIEKGFSFPKEEFKDFKSIVDKLMN